MNKVVCIKKYPGDLFTIGKEYEVFEIDYVFEKEFIVNDADKPIVLQRSENKFVSRKEYRKNKINNLISNIL